MRYSSQIWQRSNLLLLATVIVLLAILAVVTPVDADRPLVEKERESVSGQQFVPSEGNEESAKPTPRLALKEVQKEQRNHVGESLKWLAEHQNRDGSWSFFHSDGDNCDDFPNPGKNPSRVGATGLALIPFFNDGESHNRDNDRFQETLAKGIQFLLKHRNKKTGRIYEKKAPLEYQALSHGMAAYTLTLAYAWTRDPKLKKPAQMAMDYIAKTQGKDGGWRFQPQDPGDTSLLGWQIASLANGKAVRLKVPRNVYPRAMRFLDRVQEEDGAKYRAREDGEQGTTPLATSIGLMGRIAMGWPRDHQAVKAGVAHFAEAGPDANNIYQDYQATAFMFLVDGPRGKQWSSWNMKMRELLLESQSEEDDKHLSGSWFFPDDKLGGGADEGGRLYHTALATMILQMHYTFSMSYYPSQNE